MKKSNSAVSETSNATMVDQDYLEATRGRKLGNERQEIDNKTIPIRNANETLKDKMESARRNITELSRLCFCILEKGLCKANGVDNPDDFGYSAMHKRAVIILKQNIEALSEIDKFKC